MKKEVPYYVVLMMLSLPVQNMLLVVLMMLSLPVQNMFTYEGLNSLRAFM